MRARLGLAAVFQLRVGNQFRRALAISAVACILVAVVPGSAFANTAPSITPWTNVIESEEGTLGVLYGTASDPDGDQLTFSTSFGSIERWIYEAGAQWRWTHGGADGPFETTVTVTAQDGRGGSASATFAYRVLNVAPYVATHGPIFVPSDSVSPRYFRSSVSDRGDDAVTSSLHCGSNGPLASGDWYVENWRWFSCVFGTAGPHQVGIRAQDSDGAVSDSFKTVIATPKVKSLADGQLTVRGPEVFRPFGGALAMVDLNRDGRDELAIGNGPPTYDQGDFSSRHVLVMRGGATQGTLATGSLAASLAFRITGSEGETGLGSSMAAAGDVNGDGYQDLIIGSPRSETNDFKGAYVVYGRANAGDINLATMPPAHGFRIVEPGPGARVSVAGGGDIDGDGFDDVVVGSPFGGKVFVVFGRADRGSDVDLSADPSQYGLQITGGTYAIGHSFALGDVNRDGRADLVIASRQGIRGVFGAHSMPATINLGTMAASAGFTLPIAATVGDPIVATGDVNGDGFSDVLAGIRYWDYAAYDYRAEVTIYHGSASPPKSTSRILAAPDRIHEGPISSLSTGDWNGDGRDDVFIGLAWASENDDQSGSTFIVPGATSMGTVSLEQLGTWTRIDGDAGYNDAGAAVASGDFDGNGGLDLAIGAPRAWTNDPETHGRVAVFRGTAIDTAAPKALPPTATFVAAIAQTASPMIRISWPDATDNRGVVRYKLQVRRNTGSWSNVTLANPLTTKVDLRLLARNSTYQFRLRAFDAAGNRSTWVLGNAFATRTIQENSTSVTRVGAFSRVALSGASGGYVSHAATVSRSTTVSFFGRSVAFVTTLGPNRGKARILVDGIPKATVDLYSPTLRTAWVSFASPLPSSSHKLTVEVLGQKNAASTNSRVDIDAFMVLN